MSDSELETPGTALPETPEDRLDEDDRLKPEFVSEVLERVEAGDTEGARALVEPLHPADVADLFELVDRDERRGVAAARAGGVGGRRFAPGLGWVPRGRSDRPAA